MIRLWITLLFSVSQVFAFSVKEQNADGIIEPEYLDSLLKDKNYEEFARLMGIKNVDLVKPGPENKDPMFNKGLLFGDMLLTPEQEEQARQGINFNRYPGSKWPGTVPYTISSDFTSTNRDRILEAIRVWNQQVRCVKWNPRTNERAYVEFFPGNGCYSYLGRTGRSAQALSLQQNGCFRQGTILHEMDHAIGFAHEHNRSDRDEYITINWDNIPDEWKSQYEKTNSRDYGLQANYDYYSVMHYPVNAPGTNKKAFDVPSNRGVNERSIGQRNGFTQTDLNKIAELYC